MQGGLGREARGIQCMGRGGQSVVFFFFKEKMDFVEENAAFK